MELSWRLQGSKRRPRRFTDVSSGIRQNAEKAMQAFDAFLLSSGELDYPRDETVSEIRLPCRHVTQLTHEYEQALRRIERDDARFAVREFPIRPRRDAPVKIAVSLEHIVYA